ncbi:hypothetical protein J7T55_012351 [Diaporthe amygdali]|uniref:uncharacterized protein n=1 Tax=Phomopsis amygdali TaxID=1214568 RepID=UPI0022FE3204|nr:uncharacterized protein J7T55_012351 [Diaporthe amygdali]KAJ0123880.1 hypothetical protein J7T55_012351 [Diaporthe amygdali]
MSLLRLLACVVSAILLANASPTPSATSSSLGADQTPFIISQTSTCTNRTYVYCSGHDLPDDWKTSLPAAVGGLDAFCPIHQVESNMYYRTRWKNIQIYWCNYVSNYAPCSSAEYWAADALFDQKCGMGKGAWMQRETDDRRWAIGRDPTEDDGDFRPECGKW